MAFVIGLDAKDNSAQAFSSIEKRTKKTTKELEKMAKAFKPGKGNAFGDLMRANRAGSGGVGIGGGGEGGAAPAGSPGRPSSIGTGGGAKLAPTRGGGLMGGVEETLRGAGFGGVASGAKRVVGAFTGPSRPPSGGGGGGGHGAGAGAGAGAGGEGIGGSFGGKISSFAFGIGAVVGASLGIIQSVGGKHQALVDAQKDSYRLFNGTTGAANGLLSSERAQLRLSYAETTGHDATSLQMAQAASLTNRFGFDSAQSGKIYGAMRETGVSMEQAIGNAKGAGLNKIAGKAFFSELGKTLESAVHDGYASGVKDYGIGTSQGLASIYGMKVNGESIAPQRAAKIFESFDSSMKSASNLEGGGKSGLLFAAIKNQMGPGASVLDVMQRLESGASTSNLQAFTQQMDTMGLSEEQKAFFLKTQFGLGVNEARAVASGRSGIGQSYRGAGGYDESILPGYESRAASENALLGPAGQMASKAKEEVDLALIHMAESVGDAAVDGINDFKKWMEKPAGEMVVDIIKKAFIPGGNLPSPEELKRLQDRAAKKGRKKGKKT